MRPIVFVCHSLGGIVVKRAIVSAHTTDYYRNKYDSTKGVAFFATPHNGGNGVTFGDVLVRICRAVTGNARNDIMEALRRDSNIASHINRDFARRARGLRVLNFIETKPMAKPFLGIVVDRNSASLNWPEPAEIQVHMEATHRTICKYSQEDELYKRVSENMVDLISWAAEAQSPVIIATPPLPAFPTPDPDQFCHRLIMRNEISAMTLWPGRVPPLPAHMQIITTNFATKVHTFSHRLHSWEQP